MSITFLPTDPLAWRTIKRFARELIADIISDEQIAAVYNFGGVGKRLVHRLTRRNSHHEDSATQNPVPGAPAKVQ
jgi:Holliday junction resolvasome RuvABC DNA-binding subunit